MNAPHDLANTTPARTLTPWTPHFDNDGGWVRSLAINSSIQIQITRTGQDPDQAWHIQVYAPGADGHRQQFGPTVAYPTTGSYGMDEDEIKEVAKHHGADTIGQWFAEGIRANR